MLLICLLTSAESCEESGLGICVTLSIAKAVFVERKGLKCFS